MGYDLTRVTRHGLDKLDGIAVAWKSDKLRLVTE